MFDRKQLKTDLMLLEIVYGIMYLLFCRMVSQRFIRAGAFSDILKTPSAETTFQLEDFRILKSAF